MPIYKDLSGKYRVYKGSVPRATIAEGEQAYCEFEWPESECTSYSTYKVTAFAFTEPIVGYVWSIPSSDTAWISNGQGTDTVTIATTNATDETITVKCIVGTATQSAETVAEFTQVHFDNTTDLEVLDIVRETDDFCVYDPGNGCKVRSTYSVVTDNGNGVKSYQWSVNNLATIVGSSTNPTLDVETPSDDTDLGYNVTVTVTDNTGSPFLSEFFVDRRIESTPWEEVDLHQTLHPINTNRGFYGKVVEMQLDASEIFVFYNQTGSSTTGYIRAYAYNETDDEWVQSQTIGAGALKQFDLSTDGTAMVAAGYNNINADQYGVVINKIDGVWRWTQAFYLDAISVTEAMWITGNAQRIYFAYRNVGDHGDPPDGTIVYDKVGEVYVQGETIEGVYGNWTTSWSGDLLIKTRNIYNYNSTNGKYELVQILQEPNPDGTGYFGNTVEIGNDDDVIYISSSTNIYVYRQIGPVWAVDETIEGFGREFTVSSAGDSIMCIEDDTFTTIVKGDTGWEILQTVTPVENSDIGEFGMSANNLNTCYTCTDYRNRYAAEVQIFNRKEV